MSDLREEIAPWGGLITFRSATRNEPKRDGTPAVNKGYLARVETVGPDMRLNYVSCRLGRPQKRVWVGPVFATEEEALAWVPPKPVTATETEEAKP